MSGQTGSQREQFAAALLHLLQQTRVGPRYYPEERFHSELWSDHAGFLSAAISLAPMTSGQLFQDAWVTYESKWKRGGYFVEFGASDGIMSSNTLMLERHFAWTGILAEPHPQTSAQLRRMRWTPSVGQESGRLKRECLRVPSPSRSEGNRMVDSIDLMILQSTPFFAVVPV